MRPGATVRKGCAAGDASPAFAVIARRVSAVAIQSSNLSLDRFAALAIVCLELG